MVVPFITFMGKFLLQFWLVLHLWFFITFMGDTEAVSSREKQSSERKALHVSDP